MDVFSRSFKYFRRYMPFLGGAAFLGLVNVALSQIVPLVMGLLMDYCFVPMFGGAFPDTATNFAAGLIAPYASANPGDFTGILIRICAMLLAVSVGRYLLHYARWNVAHASAFAGERVMRGVVFSHMLRQSHTTLSKYSSGELIALCNSDIQTVKNMYVHSIPFVLEAFATIGLSVFFLSGINAWFMLLPAVAGVAMMLLTARYTRVMRGVFGKIRGASAEINSCVAENINGVRAVRAFAREDYEMKKFDVRNEAYRAAFDGHAKTWSKYTAFFNGVSQAVSIGSLALGIVFVLSGSVSVGGYVSFMAYVVGISASLTGISNDLGALQQSVVAGKRVFAFLDEPVSIDDPPSPVPLTGDTPRLSLRGATLTLDGKTLLKGVDLDIPFGKKVGIMGKTGSGKSAVLKLFMRFFEADGGEVSIDGINVKDVRVTDLRERFSYVSQDVFLFSDTVDGNIAFGDPECGGDEVEEAARAAAADGFIRELSDGYRTVVGERGLGLSGGQKQRVSIARAFLKRAPVLVLDDCASALDCETERKIFGNISERCGGRTLLIATHRAAAVENCDEIIYMEDGAIAERGTRDELLKKNGKFAEVYRAQAAEIAKEGII